MPGRQLRVFVSATTRDLGAYREAARTALLTQQILPITQQDFGPDHRTLEEFFRVAVASSDAVICLVGHLHGAGPESGEFARLSYTQLEYELAGRFDVPVFVFMTGDDQARAWADENAELRDRQLRHRERLSREHKYQPLGSLESFGVRIRDCIAAILKLDARSAIAGLPAPLDASVFAGRREELRQLRDALQQASPSVVAILGIPGQGKTTLVNHAVRELPGMRYARGFWFTAGPGAFSFEFFLDQAIGQLGGGNVPTDLAHRVGALLRGMESRPCLLVIDALERWLRGWSEAHDPVNADRDRAAVEPALDDLLRGLGGLTNGSKLVLTSRAMPAALDQASVRVIPIPPPGEFDARLEGLQEEDAIDLLRRLGVRGPDVELASLARGYACHPLALRLLGVRLRKLFGGQAAQAHKVSPMAPEQELHALLEDTRRHLPDPALGSFLQLAACCIEDPVPLELLAAGAYGPEWTEAQLDELRLRAAALGDWTLIEWDGRCVWLHPLIRAFFASATLEQTRSRIHGNLSAWYERAPMPEALRLADAKPRLHALTHAALAGDADRCLQLMFEPFARHRSLQEWLARAGHAISGVALCTQILALDLPPTQRARVTLARANLLHVAGRAQAAMSDASGAVELLEPSVIAGETSDATYFLAQGLATRANLVREAAASSAALADYDRAIELFATLPAAQVDAAMTLQNRGNARQDVGELTLAAFDYERAARLLQRSSILAGPNQGALLASVKLNWSGVLAERGDHEAALRLLAEAEASLGTSAAADAPPHARLEACIAVARAHALEMSGQAEQSRRVARKCAEDVAALVSGGRGDLQAALAEALLVLARANLALRRLDEALPAAERCLGTLQELISAGENQFTGLLAHARIVRAEVLYRLSDPRAGIERAAAVEQFRNWIKLWGRESDARTVYLRLLGEVLGYLDGGDEALGFLNELIEHCDILLSDPRGSERASLSVRRTVMQLQQTSFAGSVTPEHRAKLAELLSRCSRAAPLDSIVIDPR